MGYQLRHKEFGVYQGSFCGFQFWTNLSEFPEGGYHRFRDLEEVDDFIEILCSERHSITFVEDFIEILCSERHSIIFMVDDLSIEKFDKKASDGLKLEKSIYDRRN